MDYNQKPINNLKGQTMQNASQDLNNPVAKNREFTVNSETITSFFIEKLISLAITDAKRNEIEAKILSKCFSYVTNIINNYIKIEYLPYDRDDRNILVPNSKKKEFNQNLNSNKNLFANNNSNNNLNNFNSNFDLNNNNNKNNNFENAADNNSNSQNNFLNRSLSNNELIIKQLRNPEYNEDSSMEDAENHKILGDDADAEAENELFKTNENVSNLNFDENFGYFFDNRFFGNNDWTICDEPVNIFFNFFIKFILFVFKKNFVCVLFYQNLNNFLFE